MKIAVIPSGFKDSLSSAEVGKAIKNGLHSADESLNVKVIPMVDGGEGFAQTITQIKNGQLYTIHVQDPLGQKRKTHYGMFYENKQKVAVIEMAAIAGLRHVPVHQRNPLHTSTYGVGEAMLHALDHGAERILIGCGDSGTSDGGVGMAQAIGVRFKDKQGRNIHVHGGGAIHHIDQIDVSQVDPRVLETQIDVAVNWSNILCGPKGVARVFGPQKGASPDEVEHLANNLELLAERIKQTTGQKVAYKNGSGASGGLGAGLMAFAHATLHPRFDLIQQYLHIEPVIAQADLIITAEGCLDYQTPNGKIPAEVARIAEKYDKPVIALAGTIGKQAEFNYQSGIDAFHSIIKAPSSLDVSIEYAEQWLEECARNIFKSIQIGARINQAQHEQSPSITTSHHFVMQQ